MEMCLIRKIVVFFVLILIHASPNHAQQADAAIGFRDFLIGSDATVLDKHCERSMIPASYFDCYGISDITFKWIEPGSLKWPQPGDTLRSYVVTFLNPELVILDGAEHTNFQVSDENWMWSQQKQESLYASLSERYDLVWYWGDPNFEDRRDRQIEKFMNDRNHSLDAIFENGQVVLSLMSNGNLPIPPTIRIQYRDQTMAEGLLQSRGLSGSGELKKMPIPTSEAEF